MMMRSFAAQHAGDGRGFVVIAPGWVRTDLRGRHARLGVEDSVPGIADAIASQAGSTDTRLLDCRDCRGVVP